jgi:hypothetical protein
VGKPDRSQLPVLSCQFPVAGSQSRKNHISRGGAATQSLKCAPSCFSLRLRVPARVDLVPAEAGLGESVSQRGTGGDRSPGWEFPSRGRLGYTFFRFFSFLSAILPFFVCPRVPAQTGVFPFFFLPFALAERPGACGFGVGSSAFTRVGLVLPA